MKRVRPEFVNYARKAKRVDVRKLKENIWRGLKIITPKDVDPEVCFSQTHQTTLVSYSSVLMFLPLSARLTQQKYRKTS